jgi:hypothetical protein
MSFVEVHLQTFFFRESRFFADDARKCLSDLMNVSEKRGFQMMVNFYHTFLQVKAGVLKLGVATLLRVIKFQKRVAKIRNLGNYTFLYYQAEKRFKCRGFISKGLQNFLRDVSF